MHAFANRGLSLGTSRFDLKDPPARDDPVQARQAFERFFLQIELRKGLPETRDEAQSQLDRIQRLALTSNPSRLGQLVDRVADASPAFLEWRFAEFGSLQERGEAYISSGAGAFDSSMEELRDGVLLVVANRLDGLLTVLDRIR